MSRAPAYALLREELKHAKEINEDLVRALEGVLANCAEICRAEHENRNAYISAGEIGDIARAALARAKAQP